VSTFRINSVDFESHGFLKLYGLWEDFECEAINSWTNNEETYHFAREQEEGANIILPKCRKQ